MVRLHTQEDVFSPRHWPSWLMFCFAAGAVNGAAVMACDRLVTHVTGTVTRLGLELMRLTILLDFVLVLVCFVVGAMLAGLLINGRIHQQKRPLFSAPLLIAAVVTAVMAILGHVGLLGEFGGAVDEPADFVFLCALSFAMGLQNAAVATSTGQLVRTTHLTGPATDLGVSLAELFYARGDAHQTARRHAALRFGKIIAYATGAAVALPLSYAYTYLSLLLPAAVIVAATLLSIARKEAKLVMPPAGEANAAP
ncbi:MAG: YoaK family protein [Polyangiales bacterium]